MCLLFSFFFFFLWVKGAGLMPLGAGNGSVLGPPRVGSGAALLALPSPSQAGNEPRRTKCCFTPQGERFYGSSGNANPQVSPFVTFMSLLMVSQQVLGQQGQRQS